MAFSALRTRPGKTLFSVLGIALGVATAVAIVTLDETTVFARTAAKTDAFARVDLEAIPADPATPPAEALEELRANPSVRAVGAMVLGTVDLIVGGRPSGSATAIALDPVARRAPAFSAYRVSTGDDLPETDDGDTALVLVGEELARQLVLRPGDSIEIVRPSAQARTACVDGQLVERASPRDEAPMAIPIQVSVTGLLDRWHLGKQGGGSVVVIPFALVERVFYGERMAPLFWLAKDPKVSAEDLKASLVPRFAFSKERSALVGEAADERAFRNGVRVSGVLALLLGLFVIFHTLSMTLLERVREIAMLNALGATRTQIGGAFFLEGLLVAASGAAAGVGLGLGLARLALLSGYTTLGRVAAVEEFQVSWGPVLAIAGVGVVIALLGSIFPLVKARAIYPAQVLSQRDLGRATDLFRGLNVFLFTIFAVALPLLYVFVVPVLGEGSRETGRVLLLGGVLFAIFLGALLLAPRLLAALCALLAKPLEGRWPLEGFLSSRSMTEGVARVAISAAVLALVASALITIRGVTGGLRTELVSWGDTVDSKVFVSASPAIPRDRVEALRALPGIAGFESLGLWIDSPFMIRGLRADDLAGGGPFADAELRRAFDETESIVLSTPLARALRAQRGSEIPVAVPSGPPRRLQVIAVSDDLGFFPTQREYGVVSEAWMTRWFCKTSAEISHVALRIRPGADPDASAGAAAAALADLPPVKIRTGAAVRDAELADVDRDFRLFDWILGLVAALAGIGVLNALLIAAIEKRKEIGVLKALGMTRGQLARTVLLEAATTGFVGGGLGVLLGIAFVLVVMDALARLTGLPLEVTPQPGTAAAAWVGAVGLALGASLLPIARANRFRAADAVRYE